MKSRWILASCLLLAASPRARPEPEGVPVRWAEGTVHGFLELRAQSGELLAHGDQLQAPGNSSVKSELLFNFSDGSRFHETVTFTQAKVFKLETYQLVQQGKAFEQDLDVTLSQDGKYIVKTKAHKDGKEKQYTGRLDLPADTYNGLVPVIGKNIDREAKRTVHIVAFTPKPIVIPLELIPVQAERGIVRYTLKPKLNTLQKIGAAIKGQTPPDSHLWILTTDVPAFVRFEGPLYSGPVWRIDLTIPRWPQ